MGGEEVGGEGVSEGMGGGGDVDLGGGADLLDDPVHAEAARASATTAVDRGAWKRRLLVR